MNDELGTLKRKWLATGLWGDEQRYLRARVRHGEVPCVILDPAGAWSEWLAVVVRRATGVVYENQCAGVACDQRLVEGFLVPLGLWNYETGGNLMTDPLIDVFHEAGHCRYDWIGPKLPAERLAKLRRLVEQIPYWRCESSNPDSPSGCCLDESRIDEIAEAWLPVETPDGPGVLLYRNCD